MELISIFQNRSLLEYSGGVTEPKNNIQAECENFYDAVF